MAPQGVELSRVTRYFVEPAARRPLHASAPYAEPTVLAPDELVGDDQLCKKLPWPEHVWDAF